MSSFFDDASLVMIPSGYKDQKVYSVKPLDGSGDLTFSRASNATRVASNGLIEKVRTNLALQSEGFDTGSWSKVTLIVSANAGTAPNGTTTADLIYPSANSSNSVIFNGVTISSGVEYTNSVYVKASGKTWTFIRGINDGAGAFFDLSNGVVGTVQSGVTATITSIGSGWYRCSVTQTSSSTTGRLVILVVDGNGLTEVTANGTDGLLIWGAQLESEVMTDYIPTTTAAVSVGPVSGLPRLDYLGSTCPRLLLEPQRSNLVTFSEQMDNAAWVKTNATVTANATTAPDGTTSADKIIEDTQNQFHFINSNSGTFAAGSYSFSVFAKASERNILQLFFNGSANANAFANFNLQNGTVSLSASCTPSIENYGNGWYRCTIVATVSVSTVPLAYLCLQNSATASRAATYAGNGTSGLFVWGAQLEAGAYATSYIPTLGAAVTRVADDASKTGISSLIGQQEGVVYWEGILPQISANGAASESNIFNTERQANTRTAIAITHRANTGSIICNFWTGNGTLTALVTFNTPTFAAGSFAKIAFAYKSGSFALYVNGVLKASSAATFTSITTMEQINLNDNVVYYGYTTQQYVAQALLFKTRLSNSDLATLTTL
jgi:hypothetical protein